MEAWERECHVARIVSGKTRCHVKDGLFLYATPSRDDRSIAGDIYREMLYEAHLSGLITQEDMDALLFDRGLWTSFEQDQHDKLVQAIEDMKVGLYEYWSQSNERNKIRNALKKGRDELARLDGILHSMDHVTCEGIALSSKARYLIGASLLLPDGKPYWREPLIDWEKPDEIVDQITDCLMRTRINENDVRDIARNDPWRSLWASRKDCGRGLLDIAAVDVTDEQRGLMLWSGIYDSIREHPDCPAEDIVEDDDMIDGWMIIQRRKRESQQAKKRGDEIGNERIRKADEVYVVAQSVEDARKIDKLNDNISSTIKSQRMAYLKHEGQVSEMKMPDTWQRFQMEVSKLESQAIKGA